MTIRSAMILAAGRGERLAPLTDAIPKPLLKVGPRCLIEYHRDALIKAGVDQIVINVAHLADMIIERLGHSAQNDTQICYSREPSEALETGGGIHNALPLIKSDPFIVVNGDIWTDYNFANLRKPLTKLAHLVLVQNPDHNPKGDFSLRGSDVIANDTDHPLSLTFSGIGVYRAELFEKCVPGRFALAPLLHQAIAAGTVSGEMYSGRWMDVGSPVNLRLAQTKAEELFKSDS
jgi:MurNAc alpha-1-phosphate uridylyltransferase